MSQKDEIDESQAQHVLLEAISNLDRFRIAITLEHMGCDANCDIMGYKPLHWLTFDNSTLNFFYRTPDAVAVVRFLLEKGADINALSKLGYSPLHLAVQEELTAYVRVLCENGANVNIKDRHSNTPLFYVKKGDDSFDICKILIEYGANPYIKNNEGKTPFDNPMVEGFLTRVYNEAMEK